MRMYTCINCGVEVKELYRRYSPSVLKTNCGSLADKYIEYDPVIVLVDLVLLEKPAYRHLLYNSEFESYWKLMIVLLLGESYRVWATHDSSNEPLKADRFEGESGFSILVAHTGFSLGFFAAAVILGTELRWLLSQRPKKYRATDLVRALIVGGCAKLLGLLGLVWQHVSHDLHYALIHGYTMLCLLTAYSVVCESGRGGSLIGLAAGLLAHNYVSTWVWLPSASQNVTLVQNNIRS
ncbi:protein ARV1 isoform X2 [Fopius arisanus]|uniref:Protein ARV n=1 Tax=Fopius arisanus TaxID=64838 RepID=A0A9R1TPD4_9HYME|nr:PREDICTED: protein ARV1 isoform X2 [Fopius arisanus]